MKEIQVGRRERRRRKAATKMEGNHFAENEFQKVIENVEFSIKPQETQSLGNLTRKDTYTLIHAKSDFDVASANNIEQDIQVKSSEGSGNGSAEFKNLTYSLNKDSEKFSHYTYNIDKPDTKVRPIPAPRRWKSINLDPEKVSSDTDRDITEIDLDDMLVKSLKSDLSSKLSLVSNKSFDSSVKSDATKNDGIVPPVPKPRKHLQKTGLVSEKLKASAESLNSKIESQEKNIKSEIKDDFKVNVDPLEHLKSNEFPLLADLQDKTKSDDAKEKIKKQKKLIGDLLDRKEKKNSKTFSRFIKLEKKKLPKISSILKDLKEAEIEENKPEVEEEKLDFKVDSPRYKESAENGRIYVQGKNGFHLMEKDEVLKNQNRNSEKDQNGGIMGDLTVKTAGLFQKYWSRSMTYFHGILAGFGFSHAATITAIMLHFNYDPEGFIGVYSCLSLKIHYVFYTLTSLCIVSCFDRIDIGHMNRKHWQIAWKIPSIWIILVIYVISFGLTFFNQMTEARFDAFPDGNETEIWNGRPQNQVQVVLLQWYHSVWARDMLVLLAWLIIALTTFDDFLYSHINNMAKYAEVKGEDKRFRHKTDFL